MGTVQIRLLSGMRAGTFEDPDSLAVVEDASRVLADGGVGPGIEARLVALEGSSGGSLLSVWSDCGEATFAKLPLETGFFRVSPAKVNKGEAFSVLPLALDLLFAATSGDISLTISRARLCARCSFTSPCFSCWSIRCLFVVPWSIS